MSRADLAHSTKVIAIHDEQLAISADASGLRDRGMLESALDRPINQWAYEQTDLAELAAAYAFGLARNHAFVDGNKRTRFHAHDGLSAASTASPLSPDPAQATAIILSLAAGEVSEESLTRWIRDNWPSE